MVRLCAECGVRPCRAVFAGAGSTRRPGILFDDENALIQAVLDGQGLALMARSLAEGDLAAGRLVSPFDLTLADGYGYYLVYERQALSRPRNAAFRAFIAEEAARKISKPRHAPPAA